MWRNKKGSFWGFWALKCIRHFENTYPKVPIHLVWLAYISFSLLSFEIVVKQAWFHFFGDVTRNCYFMWKPGFFMFFSIQKRFLGYNTMGECKKVCFQFKMLQILVIWEMWRNKTLVLSLSSKWAIKSNFCDWKWFRTVQ